MTGKRLNHSTAAVLAGLVAALVTSASGNADLSPPGQQAPTIIAAPTISGAVTLGSTLSADRGIWDGPALKFSVRWQRCDTSGGGCSDIGGSIASTYQPAAGDIGSTLRVAVTATNQNGSATAVSAATAVISPTLVGAPAATSLPTISGTAAVGQTLSASTGSWDGFPSSYAYQWSQCDATGLGCVDLSGAAAASYLLASGDVGFTMRVAVTATNSSGSATAVSSQTLVVAAAQSSSTSGYPASFFSGPAGSNIVLPPNGGYPSSGAWIGEASGNGLTQVQSREQYFGRKFNIVSMYAQNRCDPWPAVLADAVSAGYIPMVSWSPTPSAADQIISGQADSCIRSFGNAIANQSGRVLVRPYWEFNGGWQPFSKNSDGSRATAAQENQMWQHTIDVLRTTGFFSKASVVWSVHEGYFNNGDAWNNPTPYPGDDYVDWVASGSYNWNSSDAWCGLHAGWCSFAEAITHGKYAPTYTPIGVEVNFRGKKPYMVTESGSVEDPNTAGRKGQWMIDMGNYAKTYMPGLYAIVYFDLAYSGVSWNLDTSTSSMNGFKSFANIPYFNIPNQ